jgi:hypothetical protein
MENQIKALAIECADLAVEMGAAEVTEPLAGDYDALSDLLGVVLSSARLREEHPAAMALFVETYRARLQETL